ncbi:PREDICTED: uncharacterized protein F54F2.2, isoform a-like isoform X2 [Priapulus caudatus]|nr:PREDICTED: uncharacterized protein F54F2.2, isoform a-like isoform X2 [Priapulus caudatus]
MQCNKSGCRQFFHVTCAQAGGLLCEEAGHFLDNVKYCGYCQYHYQKLQKKDNIKTIPAFKPVPSEDASPESSPEKKIDVKDIKKEKKIKEKKPSVTSETVSVTNYTPALKASDRLHEKDESSSSSAAGTPKFTTANFIETIITPSSANFTEGLLEKEKAKGKSSSRKSSVAGTPPPVIKCEVKESCSMMAEPLNTLLADSGNMLPRTNIAAAHDTESQKPGEFSPHLGKDIGNVTISSTTSADVNKSTAPTFSPSLSGNGEQSGSTHPLTHGVKRQKSQSGEKRKQKVKIASEKKGKLPTGTKMMKDLLSMRPLSPTNSCSTAINNHSHAASSPDITKNLENGPVQSAMSSSQSSMLIGPQLPNLSSSQNSQAAAHVSFPTTMEQLLERQWTQGSQFLMEQSQHFDIASLLSCLHQLRAENHRLEELVSSLSARRDHLLAVNARLAVPNNSQASSTMSEPRNTRINNTFVPRGDSNIQDGLHARSQARSPIQHSLAGSHNHIPVSPPVAGHAAPPAAELPSLPTLQGQSSRGTLNLAGYPIIPASQGQTTEAIRALLLQQQQLQSMHQQMAQLTPEQYQQMMYQMQQHPLAAQFAGMAGSLNRQSSVSGKNSSGRSSVSNRTPPDEKGKKS